jgi:hypothetical protein
MKQSKNERAYDQRQAGYRATIADLNNNKSGKATPRGGWETAYRKPGSRSQKHVSGK